MSMQALIASTALLVSGQVTGVEVQPAAPWAHAEPHTTVTLAPDDGEPVEFVVPGDNRDRVRVWGIPRFEPGSRWLLELVDGEPGLVPRGGGEGIHPLGNRPHWVLNDAAYPADRLPLGFTLVEPGVPGLGTEATEAIVRAAMAEWNEVGCSSFEFAYLGSAPLEEVDPAAAYLWWQEEGWSSDPAQLGVTSTYYESVDGESVPVGASVRFNAQGWSFTAEPGDRYASPPRIHAASVLVHELGHVLGLGHEPVVLPATMFPAYVGGEWLATLAGDDRRGACALYPTGQDECATEADCADLPGERTCVDIDGVRVCDEVWADVGEPCSRTDIACHDFCVFTDDYALEGYCTTPCEPGDCPEGFACGLTDRPRLPQPEPMPAVCVPWDGPGDDDDTTEAPDDADCSGCGEGAQAAWLLLAIPAGLRRGRGLPGPAGAEAPEEEGGTTRPPGIRRCPMGARGGQCARRAP